MHLQTIPAPSVLLCCISLACRKHSNSTTVCMPVLNYPATPALHLHSHRPKVVGCGCHVLIAVKATTIKVTSTPKREPPPPPLTQQCESQTSSRLTALCAATPRTPPDTHTRPFKRQRHTATHKDSQTTRQPVATAAQHTAHATSHVRSLTAAAVQCRMKTRELHDCQHSTVQHCSAGRATSRHVYCVLCLLPPTVPTPGPPQ